MFMTPWLRLLRHSIHGRRHVRQMQHRRRTVASSPQASQLARLVEPLEDRTLLSVQLTETLPPALLHPPVFALVPFPDAQITVTSATDRIDPGD